MSKREIKKPSKEGLEKAKNKFEELYKKKPSNEIMEIISEEESSQEVDTNTYEDDQGIAASSILNNIQNPEESNHIGI